ncbi:hypothetical protein FWD07_01550 [Candidatus Saccharibacteria bacterium]|nr:hypothetical protein [Candidatus Saccharibacteria bacterium]
MKQEIERSFLVDKTKSINGMCFEDFVRTHPHEESFSAMLDGFNKGKTTRRLRKEGAKYTFVYKGIFNEETKSREEREEVLSREEFERRLEQELNENTEIFKKSRYRIKFVCANSIGRLAELDIFHGNHEGFSTIEVEFENEQDCRDFIPPDWFGDECTGEVIDMLKAISSKNSQ